VTGLELLIDADDTLWENNVYFEAAFAEFCDFLGHSSLSPRQVRLILDEIELANAKIHGYGSLNFGRNLQQCYRHLAERHVCDKDLEQVMGFAMRILDQPLVLIEGVEETLEELSERHSLTLFTKGHPDEQRLKIDQSGLGKWFAHTAIVKEKDAASYAALLAERRLTAARTWMIGNSPKSDINPALEAGLNAVFIPHDRTWGLELQELRQEGPGELKVVERFADLLDLF
jgi:putative hydrolase of the HAD superfamily